MATIYIKREHLKYNKLLLADDSIDNFTFNPREYIIEPRPITEIVELATAFHYARKHRIDCYRANEYCKYCRKKYGCRRNKILDEVFMPNDN